jgi:hypothetical protein
MLDGIIQKAHIMARQKIFGVADDNVKYINGVKTALSNSGHHIEIVFTSHKATIKNMENFIISNKLQQLKAIGGGKTILPEQRMAFVTKWKNENEVLLQSQLGDVNEGLQFVEGRYIAPSFSVKMFPNLQTLFMADACHLHFGKHTLFSCYEVTANATMSPVAFAILFGNENTSSWKLFWKFVRNLHPCMN